MLVNQVSAPQKTNSHTVEHASYPFLPSCISALVCRRSPGCPLRAPAVVSGCWLMAHPAEAKQRGSLCLEKGCCFFEYLPITVYPDVFCNPLLRDRHYSCFFTACRENRSTKAHTVPVKRNASVTDIGMHSPQSIITSSWGLFVYTIHLIFLPYLLGALLSID